jgi:hypothetical protein
VSWISDSVFALGLGLSLRTHFAVFLSGQIFSGKFFHECSISFCSEPYLDSNDTVLKGKCSHVHSHSLEMVYIVFIQVPLFSNCEVNVSQYLGF